MNRNLFRSISITALIIFYLYLCGGLYLGAYWMFLNVNPTALISIVDIPKSFLKPFISSIGISMVPVFVFFYTAKVFLHKGMLNQFSRWIIKNEILIHRRLNKIIYFSFPWLCGLLFYFSRNSGLILLIGTVIILLLCFRVFLSNKIKLFVNGLGLNNVVFGVIIFTPIVSFITGMWESAKVYSNLDITTVAKVNQPSNVSTSSIYSNQKLKFLGFLGDKLIVSTLDNKKVIYINQDKIDWVEFEKYPNEGE